MTQLVHLNGPPGVGKSTLAAVFADRHPGTLNLDVDVVHRLIGGWQQEDNRTWQLVWPLVQSMAATQLDTGHDVIVPQYHARPEEITELENLARQQGARFREIILLDDRQAVIERFDRRACATDDPYIRFMHHQIERRGGVPHLETMYDDLLALADQRPDTVVIHTAPGAPEQTYTRFTNALQSQR